MKKNLLILSSVLFVLFITSCHSYIALENLRFGMIGENSYLVGSWDDVPETNDYYIYINNSGNWSEFDTVEKNSYYLKKMSTSYAGYSICLQGKGSKIGKRTTVHPFYSELYYDYVNHAFSWIEIPSKTDYLIIATKYTTSVPDIIPKGTDIPENIIIGKNTGNINFDRSYAVYVYIDSNYFRITDWYKGENLIPQLKISSYETGSNMSFDFTWEDCKGAIDYTLYIWDDDDEKWSELVTTTKTKISIKAETFYKKDNLKYYFKLYVNSNLTDSSGNTSSFSTYYVPVYIPSYSWNYYSKCKIKDEGFKNHFYIMRNSENTFNIYWDDGKTYYLSEYDNGKIKASWMDNGLYESGQTVKNDENSFTVFLHSKQDWDYTKCVRASNFIDVNY